MGFAEHPTVTSGPVVSYTAFSPLPDGSGGISLLHFPVSHLNLTLSGILPCEARTFLSRIAAAATTCDTQQKIMEQKREEVKRKLSRKKILVNLKKMRNPQKNQLQQLVYF